MSHERILLNRAPVLTLWAAIVAECLGFDREEALSLGKAVAGLTAQSKGRRLGIFAPTPEALKKARLDSSRSRHSVWALGFQGFSSDRPSACRNAQSSCPVMPRGTTLSSVSSVTASTTAASSTLSRNLAKSLALP